VVEMTICHRGSSCAAPFPLRTRIATTANGRTDGRKAVAAGSTAATTRFADPAPSPRYGSGWSLKTGCRGASASHSASLDPGETSKNARVVRPSAK